MASPGDPVGDALGALPLVFEVVFECRIQVLHVAVCWSIAVTRTVGRWAR